MSLTNEILPGDVLDGTKVRANFVDLGMMVNSNAVGNEQIEPGSIDTRHLTWTWTDTQTMSAAGGAGPGNMGARAQIGTTLSTNTVDSTPYEIVATVRLTPSANPWNVVLDIEIDGTVRQTITISSSDNDVQTVEIPMGWVATGATDTVKLFGELFAGTVVWSLAVLTTVAVTR